MIDAIAIFDIDGVVRDVGGSYRRALADTVEHFTQGAVRPSAAAIDALKSEGIWNNDWEASQELIYRYFESQGQPRAKDCAAPEAGLLLNYDQIVAFFQARYRGTDPVNWNGYICDEPLLMSAEYGRSLTDAGIRWGFFSGATTASARYVLERRIGLQAPVLVAMEDAPGKPDPTGLFMALERLESQAIPTSARPPVLYVGDTVADMYTVAKARDQQGDRAWWAVGILPPHVQDGGATQAAYAESLHRAGAAIVLNHIEALTPARIAQLISC